MTVPNVADAAAGIQTDASAAHSALDSQTGNIQTFTPSSTTHTFTPTPSAPKLFTEDHVNAVRQEEKQKLYPEIDSLKSQLAALQAERDEAAEAARQEQEAADAAAKAKAEEDMDVRALLAQKELEWEQRIAAEREERETAIALLEKERQLGQLQDYRAQRIEQERDAILPELIDLVTGGTPDQIEASIAGLKERTDRIMASAQAATQAARSAQPGSRVTAPPGDPLDNYSGSKSFTPDQLRDMSMNEYAAVRKDLIGNGAGNRGMFG